MENKKLSRKDFVKNCTLAFGLMPLTFSSHRAFPDQKETEPGQNHQSAVDSGNLPAGETRRGSWIRTGKKQPGDVILTQGGKTCCIVVRQNEHSAVHQAAVFLAADIKTITGHDIPILEEAGRGTVNIRLQTLDNGDLPEEIETAALTGQWESYRILTMPDCVWLVGSDFRGTAYAVYTLSERLGIDPLYLWTNYQPEHRETLILKKTDEHIAAPVIRYRGFFHDDEDILPRPFDDDGYPYRFGNVSLQWYQRFFETALRLRMNMVAPYTRVRRRYEVQQCASDWGLFYTSHHYDILLSNPFGMERFNLAEKRGVSGEWDWFENKENMMKYWRAGVVENKDLNAIWPVGLRGTDDHAYVFPRGTPANVQEQAFRDAMALQVKTVKDLLQAGQTAIYHFTLYTEMLEKYEKDPDAFHIPEEVIIVWPDDNNGIMRKLPETPLSRKHGVYYHLAYYGGENTKQNIHPVSVEKIVGEFRRILNSGATEFMLVNVSEMREFIMEARMIAEIGWEGNGMLAEKDASGDYIRWWSNEYLGGADNALTQVYQLYYDLYSNPSLSSFGSDLAEDLLDKLSRRRTGKLFKPVDPEKEKQLMKRNRKFETAFHLIEVNKQKRDSVQNQFLFENICLGLLMDWRPVQAAIILIKALREKDEKRSWALVKEAIKPLEALEIEILRAERPPFENWYRETWIRSEASPYNIHRPYQQVREFISNGGMKTPVKKQVRSGHKIPEHQLWSRFLDEMEKLKKP